jgi:hypothetical protein
MAKRERGTLSPEQIQAALRQGDSPIVLMWNGAAVSGNLIKIGSDGSATDAGSLTAPGIGPTVMSEKPPSGVMDGVNATFTLAFPPNPTDSLGLYLNGIRQEPGVDFTLSGSTITYTVPPKASDDQAARYHIFTVPDPPAPVTPPPPTTPPPSLGGGNTYNVSFSLGSDSNDGITLPWKTLAKVGASSFSPGDNILLKRGDTWHETLTIPSSGGSGNPITFADYGSGAKPIIDGSTTVGGAWTSDGGQVYRTSWSFASNNVLQNDVPLLRKTSRAAMTAGSFFFNPASSLLYVWTFTGASPAGFTIDASTNGPQYYGIIRGINKDHIVIQNLQIIKTNYTGVYFEEADDITVTGCDFVSTFQNTITLVGNLGQTNSSNVTVSNNTLTNCGTGRGLTGGGESECVGINAQGWQTGSITDNVITNQGGEGIQILSGATGITVDGNSVVNPYVTGIYVSSGYGNGGNVTNIVVSNNYVELGAMSISPNYSISTESATDRIDTVAFHHNISKGNGTAMGGLLFGAGQYGAPIRNCKIFHNVFVYDIYGIKAFGPTDDTSNHFGNNIISVGVNGRAYWVGTRAFSNALANYNIDYDLMFGPSSGTLIVEWGTGTFYTLAQWRANSTNGDHSIVANPLFVSSSDYHLQAGSPCIDAGVVQSGVGQSIVGAAPDIGAYEF